MFLSSKTKKTPQGRRKCDPDYIKCRFAMTTIECMKSEPGILMVRSGPPEKFVFTRWEVVSCK